jgi:class 3 adenylate cyclase
LPGQIHISAQTWDLVRDEFSCERRGQTALRGKGDVETYLVIERRATAHKMPARAEPAAT